MLQRSTLSALAVLSLALSGCDLLFGAPPQVIGDGRRPGGDEGEGDEGEGEEGEGEEGEGEPNVPPDIRPDPQGPNIQSISLSSSRINSNQSAELTVVVTDVDGAGDIIGPLLIEPITNTTLGTLSSPAAGTFTATISWDTWSSVDPIAFVNGGDVRFIRVQFSDNDGHQVTATERVDVFCDGNLPACDNRCGALDCQGECVGVDVVPSQADLCGACDISCTNNAGAGAACFNESPSCGGGADCILGFGSNESQIESSTCQLNGGVTLRDDNVAVWRLGNTDIPVTLSNRNSSNTETLGAELCADHGGFSFFDRSSTVPGGVSTTLRIVDVENPACLSNPSTCEPITGPVSAFGDSVDVIRCVQPLTLDGTVGHDCIDGGCTDGSICNGTTCEESCSSSFDCDLCSNANGGVACVCNTSFGRCEAPNENEGGFGEPCRNGNTCDDGNLFCDQSFTFTCAESCSFNSDCDVCNDATGLSCTCNTGTGLCEAGGGSGDFGCVTSGGRNISTTGSFSGSNSGSSTFTSPSCGGNGPEQFWKFTPPTTRSYTIGMSGFDTVLTVLDSCGGTELTCNDDDPAVSGARNSVLTVSLTGGVPVLIVADSFGSAGGSYSLTIN